MQYYVYILIDPRNSQPFYVGKGYKNRMMSHESETRRVQYNNKEKCETIQEIWNVGLQVKYEQIFVCGEKESREKEKDLIKKYGRRIKGGLLTNKHVGGNGGGRIGKQVCQYDKDGTLISEYKSASDAERTTGISLSEITAVCRGDWKIAGGFQWRWKGEEPIQGYKRKSEKRKKVKSYTMKGEFVSEYESQYDAVLKLGKTKKSATKISSCCRRLLPSYLGFQWRFSDDPLPTNIQPQSKRVVQMTMDGDVLNVFESISEAKRKTGVTSVSLVCNHPNKFKQAGGFKWKWFE
jgi:hypothetical protein